MLVDMFVVFAVDLNNPTNIKAFFKTQGDANNYANPNGWLVLPCKVQNPFYAAFEA